MRINHLAVALLIAAASTVGHAQGPDTGKVNDLATAISHAEGFGKRCTIPSRYHNPGDLKARQGSTPLPGQVRIGKASHIVFKDDEAGKAALRDYIAKMMDGRSRHFHADMTLNQVARRYAENWRPWVKIVARELGVPPKTTLRAYFHTDDVTVKVSFRPLPAANPTPSPPAVSVPESRSLLDAMLDVPVSVPPLVEGDVPHRHRFRLFHPRSDSDGPAISTVRVVNSMQDNRTSWR
jgi:hypothetical protein